MQNILTAALRKLNIVQQSYTFIQKLIHTKIFTYRAGFTSLSKLETLVKMINNYKTLEMVLELPVTLHLAVKSILFNISRF